MPLWLTKHTEPQATCVVLEQNGMRGFVCAHGREEKTSQYIVRPHQQHVSKKFTFRKSYCLTCPEYKRVSHQVREWTWEMRLFKRWKASPLWRKSTELRVGAMGLSVTSLPKLPVWLWTTDFLSLGLSFPSFKNKWSWGVDPKGPPGPKICIQCSVTGVDLSFL